MDEQTAGDDDVDLVDAFGEPSVNAHVVGMLDVMVRGMVMGLNCAQWMGSR